MDNPERRRRRQRRTRGGDPPGSALTFEMHDPQPAQSDAIEDRELERGLRGLVGGGGSQLTISAALRARDASRPSAADLAEAEERVVLVRRNWVPPDDHRNPGP